MRLVAHILSAWVILYFIEAYAEIKSAAIWEGAMFCGTRAVIETGELYSMLLTVFLLANCALYPVFKRLTKSV